MNVLQWKKELPADTLRVPADNVKGGEYMADKQSDKAEKDYLQIIGQMVEEIKFGSVSVIVQDGKVIQIEQNKKIRLRS